MVAARSERSIGVEVTAVSNAEESFQAEIDALWEAFRTRGIDQEERKEEFIRIKEESPLPEEVKVRIMKERAAKFNKLLGGT